MNLNTAISHLYGLNANMVGGGGERHERPHKSPLLPAVFDLIDEGNAMDRNFAGPTPDLHWHFSRIQGSRRSTDEKDLHNLSGQSVILPADPAFHPNGIGVEWRREGDHHDFAANTNQEFKFNTP